MTNCKHTLRLVGEIQQLLAEEEVYRRNSNSRHGAMKEMLSQLKAILDPNGVEGKAGSPEQTTKARRQHRRDGKSQHKRPSEWITFAEAARLAHVHRGTIGRMADSGEIKDNGKRGHNRRAEKSSVLQWMGRRQERERLKGYEEYGKTLDRIPDLH